MSEPGRFQGPVYIKGQTAGLGHRRLAAAVILRAVRDIHVGVTCDGKCEPDCHVCRADALDFLEGPGLELAERLDLAEPLARWLAEVVE